MEINVEEIEDADTQLRVSCCHCRGILYHLPMLAVISALALVLWWSHGFASQLISNIKDSRDHMKQYETCLKPALSCCGKENGRIDANSICKAYEALDRELTSWLTVLAIFGGFLGLVVPLVAYLLQHQKLEKERDEIREFIKMSQREQRRLYKRMEKMKQDLKQSIPQWEDDCDKVNSERNERK